MKLLRSIFIAVFFLMPILSCEEEEPLNLVGITDDFSANLSLDSESFFDNGQTYNSNTVLDITTNSNIEENQDFIIDSRVNQLSFEITNYNGNPQAMLIGATLVIGSTRINIDDTVIQNIINTEIYISDHYLLNNIARHFGNNTSANVLFTGQLNDNSVSFDATVRLNLTVGIDEL